MRQAPAFQSPSGRPSRARAGMTLIELMMATGLAALVLAGFGKLYRMQAASNDLAAARYDAEGSLYVLVARLEDEFRTTLAAPAGGVYDSVSKFSLNRALVSDPSSYERITYQVACETIPSGSKISRVNVNAFPTPPDCATVVCPAGKRPVVQRTLYPNYSSSRVGRTTTFPVFDHLSGASDPRRSALGMTMCLTSPPSSISVLIAGSVYAYYADADGVLRHAERRFFVSKEQSGSGIKLLPNLTR